MDELLTAMRDGGELETRDRLVYRFALASRTDRTAARVVLQAVRPGLGCIVQSYAPRWGRDETASMVVAAAFERIVTYPVDRLDRPAANIVRDVHNRIHRVKVREDVLEVKLGHRGDPDELLTLPAADRIAAADELIEVVDDAVATGRLSEAEADLVVRCRILGESPKQLARTRDSRPATLRLHRRRAEERLSLITRSVHQIPPAVA